MNSLNPEKIHLKAIQDWNYQLPEKVERIRFFSECDIEFYLTLTKN